jgi:hypothetical protein
MSTTHLLRSTLGTLFVFGALVAPQESAVAQPAPPLPPVEPGPPPADLVDAPPPEVIATVPPEYYEGRAVYWYGGHWYWRDDRGWHWYGSEPAMLHDRRRAFPPHPYHYGRPEPRHDEHRDEHRR